MVHRYLQKRWTSQRISLSAMYIYVELRGAQGEYLVKEASETELGSARGPNLAEILERKDHHWRRSIQIIEHGKRQILLEVFIVPSFHNLICLMLIPLHRPFAIDEVNVGYVKLCDLGWLHKAPKH